MSDAPWASDVPISMPNPTMPDPNASIPMFGFVFTENGLFHDLSPADHEELSQPTFSPALDISNVEWGDTEVDQ